MSISIPGAVFSSLVFQLKNSPSDSEGFLYGCVRSHQVENITDSQSSGTREEKRLYVESFVCFSERFKFYDHYGRPHMDRIKTLLGDGMKRVIGWFSYRRNTTHRPSMREKVVHRRLTTCTSAVSSRDFLFGLVTEQVVEGSSVHSTDYSFYNWIGTSLQPVKVGIVNLQVTATVPYQVLPLAPTPPSLPHYSSTLQQHRTRFLDSKGQVQQPVLSEELYKEILERLNPLCESLLEASGAVEREAREIEELERQLQELTTLAEMETPRSAGSQVISSTPNTADSDTTTMPLTTPLTTTTSNDTTREHLIQVAPLIDLEGVDPTITTSSSKHNGDVVDLTSQHSSSGHSLHNGDIPLLDLPNDASGGGSGAGVKGGDVGEEETESVPDSQQELF